MDIAQLRIRLLVAGLDTRYGDAIESQAQPCRRFDTIPTNESELQLGCSKLGGSPDLPIGTARDLQEHNFANTWMIYEWF